ncbi:hypothetical protein ACJMK2_040894 [Sinanodonta woodiana]|uniref:PLAT domain-containing protein n=1 Tax=Sinanodonta woodiana TaxID=1069815 RepID=A0ABD3W2E8_SINWO
MQSHEFHNIIGNTICYGDLGCFRKNNPVFTINLFPESPDKINITFRLFTRQNEQDNTFKIFSVEDVVGIKNSHFDHCRPTKIVVHGYLSRGYDSWMLTMKNELLKAGDFNVILIYWNDGSQGTYNQATANARVVGALTAKLITVLMKHANADPADFHIIGHSIGAHIGGYVGERTPNLGRITGLDPAALIFQSADKVVRLDRADAKFVDVIHTDGGNILMLGLGMFDPMGHADYYPNGGIFQPGCYAFHFIPRKVVCRHLRSLEYFIESINSVCPFRGYRCPSYTDFKQGSCMPCSEEGCGYMGFHADRVKLPAEATNMTYFLDTGDSEPFCRYHYQIKVSSAYMSDSGTEKGMLMVNLIGSKGELGQTYLTSDYMNIEPGKNYVFVVTSINDIGKVKNATVTWLQKKQSSGKIYIDHLDIMSTET